MELNDERVSEIVDFPGLTSRFQENICSGGIYLAPGWEIHGAAVVAVRLWASSRQMGNRAMGTTTSIPRVRILVLSRHVSLRSTQLLED